MSVYPEFKLNNPIHRGEMLIANLDGTGHETYGSRPVVVIQNDIGNKHSPTIIVAPITSSETVFNRHIPVNMHIDSVKYGMVYERSTILLNQITTIDKTRITKKIGKLDSDDLKRLDDIIKLSLDLGKEQEGKGMEALQKVFDYQGSQVRTVLKDGEPWFVAKDVCDILNLADVSMSTSRLEVDELLIQKLFVSGQNRDMITINEAGLYSLVLTSNKPEAKAFKRWITHDVIPQIRKTGSYSVQTPVQLIAAGYKAALDMIEEMKPKALSFDSLMSADGLYTIADAAKVLNFEGIGPKKIFEILQSEGFLFKRGNWHAKQSYIVFGYFVEKTRPVDFGSANTEVYTQVFVTPKGLDMLDKHFLRNGFKKNPMAVNQ